MGRLCVRGLDAIDLLRLDGPRQPLHLRVQARECLALLDDDFVELFAKVFEVRKLGFDLFQPVTHLPSVKRSRHGFNPERNNPSYQVGAPVRIFHAQRTNLTHE